MIRQSILISVIVFSFTSVVIAQSGYWQQRVEYTMSINMNVATHQFDGHQKLIYYNNSPDTLFKVYYHLYFNAFQPGSMMDVRSRIFQIPIEGLLIAFQN